MRSLLLIPGCDPDAHERALASGADALILDLDAGAPPTRAEAYAATLALLDQVKSGPMLFVRVGSLAGAADDDLAAIMPGCPAGIVLSKAESGADVQHLASLLAVHEAILGFDDGTTGIFAITGTSAASVLRMPTFEDCGPRLRGLAWSAEELAMAIGAEATRAPDGRRAEPLMFARALTVLAARAAGAAAVDTVFPDVGDAAALVRECEQARRDGFCGKLAIHPVQVAIINEVFDGATADT